MLIKVNEEVIFKENGLQIFDVEELSTHGGSLRLFAQRADTGVQLVSKQVVDQLRKEVNAGMNSENFYKDFQKKASIVKNDLLKFLINAKQEHKKVVAYGAAAKGSTLLNYAGIKKDLLAFVVDKSPSKQGKYMPGSRIPIYSEQFLKNNKPDYVLILPWNLKIEVINQLSYMKKDGVNFLVIMPKLEII